MKERASAARPIGYFCAVVLFVVLSGNNLTAETLYLENGQVIRGIVLSQDRETIRFRTTTGIITVLKTQIRRMTFDHFDPGDTEAEKEAKRKTEEERRKIVEDLNRELEKRRQGIDKKGGEEETRRKDEKSFFQNEFFEEKERRKKEGFQRSLLLPGWGQYHKNQSDRGKAYLGGFLILTGTALLADYVYRQSFIKYNGENQNYLFLFYQRHNLALAYPYYQRATEERNRANQSQNLRMAALLGIGLVYVISAADARYTEPELDWVTERMPYSQFQLAFRYNY